MKKGETKYHGILGHVSKSVLVVLLSVYAINTISSQCVINSVSSGAYIQNDCGNLNHQISLGTAVPIYGNCGNFYFSPPLTDHTNKVNPVKEVSYSLQITPNPAFDYIFLSWPYAEDIQIMMYNQMGQLVSSNWITGNTTNIIDIEHLKTGCYILKAQNSVKQIFISKLIKQ
jgi:hypothetical protein